MCTQEVQLSISYRQFGKTSEGTHKRSNSQHGIGSWARLQNVHTRCTTLNMGYAIWQDFRMCTKEVQLNTGLTFGKTSECAHKRSNYPHGIGIWQDIRMCTQELQLSPRDRQFGKTSEYEHKRSNSQHGIGESAKLPNVHTRCPTLKTGKAAWQDFRMCTQEVRLSTRERQFGKTSECAHKRCNSQHAIGN
ncbi:hypothetical protein PoB_004619500 [Plakobranchus ocellatus]|uniref:Uncharacterized protein n=1 Tax=Plakobranchus ocellatus TaxID=259542 RepID=A0AAV4BGL6_9GAST|nr:hypothetical protein PoB_004619500 [Plakobranchus ocellatus]